MASDDLWCLCRGNRYEEDSMIKPNKFISSTQGKD